MPMRSRIVHTISKGALQDLGPVFDLAAADSAAGGAVDCTVLEAILQRMGI